MSTTITRKQTLTTALGAGLIAAAAAPALLFLGAGTAHAGGAISNSADYLGTTVKVTSDGATYGSCVYSAFPISGVGIAPIPRHFYLPAGGTENLWFPGVKLNTTWQVNVNCDHGGAITATTLY